MAALWQLSRTKEYDVNGNAVVGAKAYFYNVGTTTPQTVYSDAGLSESHDQPVETDSYGRWPAVFLNSDPGEYRQRVTDADDVLLFDDDDVSVPLEASFTPPEAGDTSTELLFQTGDVKHRYGTGTLAGYVRGNGRTIGSASSGATERANDDCEDLFLYLYDADTSLAVSGGRGANAAADWAANKTIALPDFRDRALIGLGDMGTTDANRIADSLTDGPETNTTLGATVGASTVTLSTTQIPSHNHDVNPPNTETTSSGSHRHDIDVTDPGFATIGTNVSGSTVSSPSTTAQTESDGAHTHNVNIPSFTSGSTGGGSAHLNVQPSMFITIYIKL